MIQGRFERVVAHNQQLSFARRATVIVLTYAGLLVLLLIGVWAGLYLYGPGSGDRVCAIKNGSLVAFLQLATCVGAILAFALITSSRRATVTVDVIAQGTILVLVALIQWYGMATPSAQQASDLPYRHVFGVWAPCIVAVVVLAPWIANLAFEGTSGVPTVIRQRFRQLLRQTELFLNRHDPELSGRRIGYAIVYGPAYHPLHLLLLPSLVALVAPVKWLYLSVFAVFILSFLLLIWGNVSSRWQELITYIERWFLRGTPLLISLFVIIVAILRLVQFDYVSSILDAMPFGMTFGLVVMNYVLFWLVEYWMSRVAALHLLGVLGETENEVRVPYAPTVPLNPNDPIRVNRQGRFLASHGTGRFVVLGTVGDLDPPVNPPQNPPGQPVRAFQTYYLTELFSRLGDQTGNRQDHEYVSDINQRTGMYFFRLNSLLFLVTMFFAVVYLAGYYGNNAMNPVVTAYAAPQPGRLVDLSALLQQQGEPVRPAVIVVGSGGGTRAALYTASVLKGLHRLGVDRDIVLASGVSGGGVALAYFAANRDVLTAQSVPGQRGHCPDQTGVKVDDEWACFTDSLTKPFIEDVLNGATEWRLFRTTALSVLLAESFERSLFARQPTLGSFARPALILNSTIVGHPADESDALTTTIDPATACDEAERPFNLMSGGRLIFTNLLNTDSFPTRRSPIADVRLPYQLVQDTDTPLASAAALNANFPPVFPNARIRVRSDKQSGCEYRSYYVTDGGAEENLGLISGLYALESALAKIPAGARLKPIHVVIAEASGVAYDYRQDRGISTLFGGPRERLAGGLTNALRDKIEEQLQRLTGERATIRFHYLGLPLAFRARGGFGTHWMYAQEFHLNDPRLRTAAWLNFIPFAGLTESKAAINRADLEELWLALHDPDDPFCEHKQFKSVDAKKVQGWICGSGGAGSNGRDLHMDRWKELVDELRPYRG